MSEFRYSEWDGSQNIFALNADDLMDELQRANVQRVGLLVKPAGP